MNFKRFKAPSPVLRAGGAIVSIAIAASIAACSGTARPKPAELPPNSALMGVRQAWTVKLPTVAFPLQTAVSGDVVTVAAANGTVVAIDARAGTELWRARVDGELIAGVGSDGSMAAVVTKANEVVVLQGGKVLWKERLPAETFTAPLVAGRRVFTQTADRTTIAFDGQTGRRLWTQTRTAGDSLVLRKPGVIFPVGDTLVAGIGARLVGMNPANGVSRWEVPIASPRGTNDVERLVDLVGPVNRVGETVCARAYYAAVGCVDTTRGMLWNKPTSSAEGVGGDDRAVYGTESNGNVVAWRRTDGAVMWTSERLRLRTLTAPLAAGRALVVGEDTGTLHFLSRDDGSPLNRLTPDGSAIAAAPVLAANTVVVVTRNGGVFGYRPE